jgi:hypothetical protein
MTGIQERHSREFKERAYQTPRQVHFALARPETVDTMGHCQLRLRNGNALRSQLPMSPQDSQPLGEEHWADRIRNNGPLSDPLVV